MQYLPTCIIFCLANVGKYVLHSVHIGMFTIPRSKKFAPQLFRPGITWQVQLS